MDFKALFACGQLSAKQKLKTGDPALPINPPTFANPNGEKKEPLYFLMEHGGRKDVVLDTHESQANRIEPKFQGTGLVPEIVIKVNGDNHNVLEIGHRIADGVLRYSTAEETVKNVLTTFTKGDASPVAKFFPTSLIFGAWDSRGENCKMTRAIDSRVTATDVVVVQRYSQYVTALSKEYRDTIAPVKKLSNVGLNDCPVSGLGGVLVRGEIVRDTTLNLRLIRRLRSTSKETTEVLQSYILGLALFAMTTPMDWFFRQGCNLFPIPGSPISFTLIAESGEETSVALTPEETLTFAMAAAQKFGVGENRIFEFQPEKVRKAKAVPETEEGV
jgi:CRISPR-associated protein Csb1